jgi:hypothetical protein
MLNSHTKKTRKTLVFSMKMQILDAARIAKNSHKTRLAVVSDNRFRSVKKFFDSFDSFVAIIGRWPVG